MRSFFLLALLVATLTNFAYGGVVTPDALVKRDDYFPARVPYVFPAPGENPVADELRARRPGGVLLALDGALYFTHWDREYILIANIG
jgi:hypothetical protein